MLWQGRRESENVEDVRGSGGRRLAVGGGIGGVIVVVLYLLLGGDPQAMLDSQQQAQLSQPGQIDNQAPHDGRATLHRKLVLSPLKKIVTDVDNLCFNT